MGCRCKERAVQLRSAVAAGARGELRAVAREIAAVGKTLREDLRSGALARAAQSRLALLRRR
jgi:hypothetical protein